jgi:RNA polymerase sigma-70 factor (ECF subfamily)
MEDNELKLRLYEAIDQLPEQCQKVFRMSRFEGLKQQEIADRLGISIKTVKNHITHALQVLHKVLAEWNRTTG